ncbi:MAG: hypothetical protein U1F43_24970 [Myxococcota bacterium]
MAAKTEATGGSILARMLASMPAMTPSCSADRDHDQLEPWYMDDLGPARSGRGRFVTVWLMAKRPCSASAGAGLCRASRSARLEMRGREAHGSCAGTPDEITVPAST